MRNRAIDRSRASCRAKPASLLFSLLLVPCVPALAQQAATSEGEARQVPPVAVTGEAGNLTPDQRLQADGTAAQGYKASTMSGVGPFDAAPVLDVPLSINIAPSELIENQLIYSSYQLFNIDPATQPRWPDTLNNPSRVVLRGFFTTNNKQDGLPIDQWRLINMEDKERAEIITGLSGFFYGWGDPGGVINYVQKRPTATPLANITIGDYGGSNGFAHGDFGGPIDSDGRVGYRFNIVGQAGNTAIDEQHLRRQLYSLALDFHLAQQLLLQVNGSFSDYHLDGPTAFWGADTGADYSSVPDNKRTWSQPWAVNFNRQKEGAVMLRWDINSAIDLRASVNRSNTVLGGPFFLDNLEPGGGYSQTYTYFSDEQSDTVAEYAYLDFNFDTGPIHHKLTAGYNGYYSKFLYGDGGDFEPDFVVGTNVDSPVFAPAPTPPAFGPLAKQYTYFGRNGIIGDEIALSERISLLVGLNDAEVGNDTFNGDTGALTQHYGKSKLLETASVIYKAVPDVSTYFTFTRGLEQGAAASPTDTNAGQVFPPFLDNQYELGAKAALGKVLLTGSLFWIDEAAQFDQNNGDGTTTFVQSGRETHEGAELGVSGRVLDSLTLWGGLTLMNATYNRGDPTLVDKRPIDVADQLVKLTAEYAVPGAPGLVVTGGAYYTGKQFADTANALEIPSFVIFDGGFRYSVPSLRIPIMLRLNAVNLAGKRYWMSGTSLGEPRTVAFSVQAGLF